MARLKWDETGKKTYQTGVSKAVVYPISAEGKYDNGYAWSGVSNVTLNASGGEPTPVWADNIKYLEIISEEELGLTIEAYQSPAEFDECDGMKDFVPGAKVRQQKRKMFGFCYRTEIGDDVNGIGENYLLRLVYGCKASPSEQASATISDSPEAQALSWTVSTTPVPFEGFKPTSVIEIDSRTLASEKLTALEAKLYGDSGNPELPLPDELKTLLTQ